MSMFLTMNDVWWAMATRSRPDKGLFLIPHAFGFPRDPFEIHQSKLGIDATAPLNQWEEFERKTVPGADTHSFRGLSSPLITAFDHDPVVLSSANGRRWSANSPETTPCGVDS